MAKYQQAATDYISIYIFFIYLWCERLQFNANHYIYNKKKIYRY